MKVVILAGGGGTRLWPVSRIKTPKQASRIFGKKTLLQQTFLRLKKGFSLSDIFVSAGEGHFKEINKQIPQLSKKNYILEPYRKDTAAAIGLAAVYLHRQNPRDIFLLANSDHVIKDEKECLRIAKLAGQLARKFTDYVVLIGVNPTYPETGYGYIKLARQKMKIGKDIIFEADKFVEKPSLEKAKQYLKNWAYLWNPAMFVFRADKLLELFKKHLPPTYKILMKIEKAIGTKKEKSVLKQEFKKIKPISIDFGIMEKLKKMLVVPGNFGWMDIGHWRSVKEILSETAEENVIRGEYLGVETRGCLIYNLSNKLVATAGIENMIIVHTKDALLICQKDKAQDVKKIVEELKKQKKHKYL